MTAPSPVNDHEQRSAALWPAEDERRALRIRVAEHIEAHPELHDQGQWARAIEQGLRALLGAQ